MRKLAIKSTPQYTGIKCNYLTHSVAQAVDSGAASLGNLIFCLKKTQFSGSSGPKTEKTENFVHMYIYIFRY